MVGEAREREPVARAWFSRLAEELNELALAHKVNRLAGDSVRFLEPPFEVSGVDAWPAGTGWYIAIAKPNRGPGQFSVWLDRYLDLCGDAHLGVWYEARRATAVSIADALLVPANRRYTWKHRDDQGLLEPELGRAENARIGTWLFDDWRSSEAYVGEYVVSSPQLQDPRNAVGPVCQALRELADAANNVHSPRSDAKPDVTNRSAFNDQQYRALMERLVRPGQARFRRTLLERFKSTCVITGCVTEIVLEAAHIKPVSEFGSDAVDNGLLLRADLHRLFDYGRISISGARESRVLVAKSLGSGPYGYLLGQRLAVTLSKEQRINLAVRNQRWTDDGLTC
jgi:hypothetical protein